MSPALESNASDHRNGRSGFGHGIPYMAICDSPDPGMFTACDRRYPATAKAVVDEQNDESCSESSSSIGSNSDDLSAGGSSDDGDCDGDSEVQSEFKLGALDCMDALEEVLPVKKGISNFYCGKSKSFTSLADVVSFSSIKDIVKPENAYSRRRKNLLAYRNLPPRNNSGGISKKLTSCSRSALALAVAMSGSEKNNYGENSNPRPSTPAPCLPPLPPHGRKSPNKESSISPPRQNFSPWRSFSLSDLQCAAAAAATPAITRHDN